MSLNSQTLLAGLMLEATKSKMEQQYSSGSGSKTGCKGRHQKPKKRKKNKKTHRKKK